MDSAGNLLLASSGTVWMVAERAGSYYGKAMHVGEVYQADPTLADMGAGPGGDRIRVAAAGPFAVPGPGRGPLARQRTPQPRQSTSRPSPSDGPAGEALLTEEGAATVIRWAARAGAGVQIAAGVAQVALLIMGYRDGLDFDVRQDAAVAQARRNTEELRSLIRDITPHAEQIGRSFIEILADFDEDLRPGLDQAYDGVAKIASAAVALP